MDRAYSLYITNNINDVHIWDELPVMWPLLVTSPKFITTYLFVLLINNLLYIKQISTYYQFNKFKLINSLKCLLLILYYYKHLK